MTAGSLLNDLLTKPARALIVLGALENGEEGRRKVNVANMGDSQPGWFHVAFP